MLSELNAAPCAVHFATFQTSKEEISASVRTFQQHPELSCSRDMVLVDYSDSEESSADEKSTQAAATQASTSSARPTFQKVVDRSDPHKIKVNLPEFSHVEQPDDSEAERTAKRPRLGAGGLSDFNSFLPAPKKSLTSRPDGGTGRSRFSAGFSFKTGANPAFSREPVAFTQEEGTGQIDSNEDADAHGSLALSKEQDGSQADEVLTTSTSSMADPEKPGRSTPIMFKPLSVARKPIKKKKTEPMKPGSPDVQNSAETSAKARATSKVSLFSLQHADDEARVIQAEEVTYTPMVYEPWMSEIAAKVPDSEDRHEHFGSQNPMTNGITPGEPNAGSLDLLAADLNLSAAAKRQLLGRGHGRQSVEAHVNITNFNTDEEYNANEAFRQAGEQPVHNPVRAITAGKHSLKQLVNAVTNQKDALEEQFSAGRRNKKEAGSRYGW